jgi:hypothetical protein
MSLARIVQAFEAKKIGILPNFDYFRGARKCIFRSLDVYVIRTFGAAHTAPKPLAHR